MSIHSYKHPNDNRPHIPSQEEAGDEQHAPTVTAGAAVRGYPRNPVVERGQDPELFWLGKYGADDREAVTAVDVRSLYRSEHVEPETLIKNLARVVKVQEAQPDLFLSPEGFGDMTGVDEWDKVTSYYAHADRWRNRLVLGDSLLVMASLAEREGFAGQVQCVYMDPTYGIKYGSNWQMRMDDRTVKDGDDAHLSGEPEVIRAYRDTWEKGVHSYLSYLRDRLLVARELLTESGSCFVQISDDNVHLVRCLMDEVFGSENFCGLITFKKTGGQSSTLVASVSDYILWYARDKNSVKYRQLYFTKDPGQEGAKQYNWIELPNGERRSMTKHEAEEGPPNGARIFQPYPLVSMGTSSKDQPFDWKGKRFYPSPGRHWSVSKAGLDALARTDRLLAIGNTLRFVTYLDDYPVTPITNLWGDTQTSGFAHERRYVVQTHPLVIQRCVLMTTDPGDLVLGRV